MMVERGKKDTVNYLKIRTILFFLVYYSASKTEIFVDLCTPKVTLSFKGGEESWTGSEFPCRDVKMKMCSAVEQRVKSLR